MDYDQTTYHKNLMMRSYGQLGTDASNDYYNTASNIQRLFLSTAAITTVGVSLDGGGALTTGRMQVVGIR
jgi:hypothetical protein